tara:strand:- start:853 stop:2166 length:1314 start_codon:yes stop_codon:yes gene_type:complete
MSSNIVEELPARKFAPTAAPAAKKKGGSGKGSSAKDAVTQAVYDIRYKARKEDIDLKTAYTRYMANSSLTPKEKAMVHQKLFGKGGVKEAYSTAPTDWAFHGVNDAMYKVFVEDEQKEIELKYLEQLEESDETKYNVRVKDVDNKTYTRRATRSKITALRAQPHIKSVELTDSEESHGGGRNKKDYDGDGKVESGSKEHAGAVHNAIQRKKGGKEDGKDTRKEEFRSSLIKRVEEKLEFRSKLERIAEELPVPDHIKRKQQQAKPSTPPSVAPAGAGAPPAEPVDPLDDQIAHLKKRMEFKKLKQAEKLMDTDNDSVDTNSGNVKESKVNTPECEKKPEKEKDMRGTYAKLNLVKNKIRSMGCKNPIVMTDEIDDVKEESSATGSTKHDAGGSNSQYNADGTKKVKKHNPFEGQMVKDPKTGKMVPRTPQNSVTDPD